MKVYFIGAGPGDPELLTLKGKKIIEQAGIIIYAGSLVRRDILKFAKKAKEIYNSATMDLDEIREVYLRAKEFSLDVARLHSGDPSIYGAINEQMAILDELHIPYEVIPGISSFQAASAVLCQELTIPGVSQTVILTRLPGRTPMPREENLRELVKARATLILFLSVDRLHEIVQILKTAYPPETPVIIAYKVSMPDEEIVRGTIRDILIKMDGKDIKKTALVMVGEVFNKRGNTSMLYKKSFKHSYRK